MEDAETWCSPSSQPGEQSLLPWEQPWDPSGLAKQPMSQSAPPGAFLRLKLSQEEQGQQALQKLSCRKPQHSHQQFISYAIEKP